MLKASLWLLVLVSASLGTGCLDERTGGPLGAYATARRSPRSGLGAMGSAGNLPPAAARRTMIGVALPGSGASPNAGTVSPSGAGDALDAGVAGNGTGAVAIDGGAGSTIAPGGGTKPMTSDAFVQKNLDVVNRFRAQDGAAPLMLDTAMTAFAQDGSVELSQDHAAHQHFSNASDAPFRGSAGENQGDPSGWPRASDDDASNETTQIEQIMQAMYDEGPGGGHHDNMVNPQYTRLGVGLVTIDGQLFLTNDFTE